MKKNIFWLFILLILILLGLWLRLLYINTPLWYDEACSWMSAGQSFPFGIMNNLLNEDLQHTPLYFFFLHFWMNIFSQSETALRLFSLVFGIASLPLVYVVSKKISNKNISLIAMTLCAFSPLLVLFSVEVRMYSGVIFLVLLSLNFLIDYEQKHAHKSLIKMTVTNILIPYTFVGGIFYNFSLLLCYGYYLFKNKKEYLKNFLKFELIEWLFLIPYFVLIGYYAKQRSIFVVSHEGVLHFSNILDIIRNFFGVIIDTNVYWPSGGNYSITFIFTLLVIIPCVYFVYGFIQAVKSENKFLKTLSYIMLVPFALMILSAFLEINVLTVRYILYILPPVIILSVAGLFSKLSKKHLAVFFALFLVSSFIFSCKNSKIISINKENAFKSPANQCVKWELDYRDVVIMPFGSDAPYYFRDTTMPVIFNADLHKIVRNPYGIYYDKEQIKYLLSDERYKFIYGKINEDKVFSKSFEEYFYKNVISKTEKGRYAVIIMYGEDNNIIKPVEKLRNEIKSSTDVKNNILYTMFSKYMCDIIAMLNANFKYVETLKDSNYTYYIYQKQ